MSENREGDRGEAWRVRWARRALTLPLYFALWVAYVGLVPLLLPAVALYDLSRGSRMAATRTVAFFGWYLLCEILGLLVAFALWLGYRALPWVDREKFLRWNFHLQCLWARALGGGAFRLYGMRVENEAPADLGRKPLLLTIRHASTADTILAAMLIASRYDIVLRYVLKRELLWDPCLDVVGNRLVNVFVRRGGEDTAAEVAAVAALADGVGPGGGVLIYPEGTRFSTKKREQVLAKLAQRGDEAALRRASALRGVLPPRLGGTLALLDRAKDWDIAVCAHAGLEGSASFHELWNGALVGRVVHVRTSVFSGATLPATREGKIEWLFERWSEVDAFVASRAR
jgi:1-acyl-sn-glycerol-3-phosphate acyltransferase